MTNEVKQRGLNLYNTDELSTAILKWGNLERRLSNQIIFASNKEDILNILTYDNDYPIFFRDEMIGNIFIYLSIANIDGIKYNFLSDVIKLSQEEIDIIVNDSANFQLDADSIDMLDQIFGEHLSLYDSYNELINTYQAGEIGEFPITSYDSLPDQQIPDLGLFMNLYMDYLTRANSYTGDDEWEYKLHVPNKYILFTNDMVNVYKSNAYGGVPNPFSPVSIFNLSRDSLVVENEIEIDILSNIWEEINTYIVDKSFRPNDLINIVLSIIIGSGDPFLVPEEILESSIINILPIIFDFIEKVEDKPDIDISLSDNLDDNGPLINSILSNYNTWRELYMELVEKELRALNVIYTTDENFNERHQNNFEEADELLITRFKINKISVKSKIDFNPELIGSVELGYDIFDRLELSNDIPIVLYKGEENSRKIYMGDNGTYKPKVDLLDVKIGKDESLYFKIWNGTQDATSDRVTKANKDNYISCVLPIKDKLIRTKLNIDSNNYIENELKLYQERLNKSFTNIGHIESDIGGIFGSYNIIVNDFNIYAFFILLQTQAPYMNHLAFNEISTIMPNKEHYKLLFRSSIYQIDRLFEHSISFELKFERLQNDSKYKIFKPNGNEYDADIKINSVVITVLVNDAPNRGDLIRFISMINNIIKDAAIGDVNNDDDMGDNSAVEAHYLNGIFNPEDRAFLGNLTLKDKKIKDRSSKKSKVKNIGYQVKTLLDYINKFDLIQQQISEDHVNMNKFFSRQVQKPNQFTIIQNDDDIEAFGNYVDPEGNRMTVLSYPYLYDSSDQDAKKVTVNGQDYYVNSNFIQGLSSNLRMSIEEYIINNPIKFYFVCSTNNPTFKPFKKSNGRDNPSQDVLEQQEKYKNEYSYLPICQKKRADYVKDVLKILNNETKLSKNMVDTKSISKKSTALISEERGSLPTSINEFFSLFSQESTNKITRVGVPNSLSSLIHCILLVIDKEYSNSKDRISYVKEFREIQMPKFSLNVDIVKQEMYGYTKEEINNSLFNPSVYLDINLVYRYFEELLDINIFGFVGSTLGGTGKVSFEIPRFYKSLSRPSRLDRKTIFVYRKEGSQSKSFNYELITINNNAIIDSIHSRKIYETFYNSINQRSIINLGNKYELNGYKELYSNIKYERFLLDKGIIKQGLWNSDGKTNITKQFINIYGQTYGIIFKYENENVLMVTRPTRPFITYKTETFEYSNVSLSVIKKLMGDSLPTGKSIIDNKLIGLWYQLSGIDNSLYFPIKEIVTPIEYIDTQVVSPAVLPNSILSKSESRMMTLKKLNSVILQLAKWVYIIDRINDKNNLENIEQYIATTFAYENATEGLSFYGIKNYNDLNIRNLPVVNNSSDAKKFIKSQTNLSNLINRQMKITAYNKKYYNGLSFFIRSYHKSIESLNVEIPNRIIGTYNNNADFKKQNNVDILLNDKQYYDWLAYVSHPNRGLISTNIDKTGTNPYMYKNIADELYLIQKLKNDTLLNSLFVSYYWQIKNVNLGYESALYLSSESFILANLVGSLNVKNISHQHIEKMLLELPYIVYIWKDGNLNLETNQTRDQIPYLEIIKYDNNSYGPILPFNMNIS